MATNYENQTDSPRSCVDRQKVDMFIMANQKYFPAEKMVFLREKLYALDDTRFALVSTIQFKDPTMLLIISVVVGFLGIDRFMIGDVGMGILKLLTGGGFGILAIIDWCTIQKKVRESNFNKVMTNI